MSTIRVFNLTDVDTLQLKQFGLTGATIVVGRALIPPGGSAEVADDVVTRNGLEHYVRVGAAAVNSLPPSYVVLKERLPKPAPPPAEEKTAVFEKVEKSKKGRG